MLTRTLILTLNSALSLSLGSLFLTMTKKTWVPSKSILASIYFAVWWASHGWASPLSLVLSLALSFLVPVLSSCPLVLRCDLWLSFLVVVFFLPFSWNVSRVLWLAWFGLSCLQSCLQPCSCLVLSCLTLSCLMTAFWPSCDCLVTVLSCLVLSCVVLCCLVLSCVLLSCMSCLVLSCVV